MKTLILILAVTCSFNLIAQQPDCFDACFYDPEVLCISLFDPVCGCDGVEYSNSCFALTSGIPSWTYGACSSSLCNAETSIQSVYQGSTGTDDEPQSYAADEYCFQAESNNELSEEATFQWDFGNGETSSELSPCASFTAISDGQPVNEDYHVVLTVTDGDCRYTSNLLINCNAQTTECLDLEDVDFGVCAMFLGVCVINSSCVDISGCSTTAFDGVDYSAYFFTSYEDCSSECGSCVNPTQINLDAICPTVVIPVCGCDGITYNNSCEAENYYGITTYTDGPCSSQIEPCDELSNIDFGFCDMLLGVGIVDGLCTYVSGCSYTASDGVDYSESFFTDMASCSGCDQSACFNPQQVDPNGICDGQYLPVCGCDSVTYINECGAINSGVTSWIEGECLTDLIEENTSLAFIVYPNPSEDLMTIEFNQSFTGKLRLINNLGQTIHLEGIRSQRMLTLDVSSHDVGFYTLIISDNRSANILRRVLKK